MALPVDFMSKFDRQGNPISEEKWEALQSERGYRFVLTTRQANDVCVITIWDGFDPYRMDSDSPHLIFETTAFRPSLNGRGICLEPGEELRWVAIEEYEHVRHGSEEFARAYNIATTEKIIGRQL